MRTKTLLLTAALGAAGVASSMAQTVYSLNAVGYVNISAPAGFSIIANPLNASTNNLNTILTSVPDGTGLYFWDSVASQYNLSTALGGQWFPDNVLNPGDSAFLLAPTATTLTFVGEVPQGNLTTHVPAGFSLKSALAPLSVSVGSAAMGFPQADGDGIYSFSNASGQYSLYTSLGGSFIPDYVPAVGEGFFVLKATPTDWNLTFSVNN